MPKKSSLSQGSLSVLFLAQRSPGLLGHSPINAFQKHGKLGGRHADFTVFGGGPNKTSPLQALGKEAGSLEIPPDDLEQVPAPPSEYEQVTTTGIKLQNGFCLSGESVETTAHVGDARR